MDIEHTGPLVPAQWLVRNLHSDIVIADCRWDLMDHSLGHREYMEGHVPGAFHVSMERDLADLSVEHRGRHPMPDAGKFSALVESIGISDGTTVVCYDNNCSGAARMWFLLKYYGHDDVYILDGGIGAYTEAGGELSKDVPKPVRGSFHPKIRDDMVVGTEEVRSGKLNLVDSRAPERYRGEFEPIDPKKGHIPGASNFPFEIYIENGRFRDRDFLRNLMNQIGENPVFYCGSGVTSCIPYVASVIAGAKARIYPGSFSEWSRYDDTEVVRGNSKT